MDLTNKQIEKIRKIIEDGKAGKISIDGKTKYISQKNIKKVRDEEKKEGGLLPLATLLPIIFSGLGATAGVATGVSKIVKDVQDSKEQQRHNKVLEEQNKKEGGNVEENSVSKIVKDVQDSHNKVIEEKNEKEGGNVEENSVYNQIKKFSKKTGFDKESRKMLKQVLHNLSEVIDVKETKDGSGIYLNPYNPIETTKTGSGLYDIVKDFSNKTGLEKETKKLLKNVLYNLSEAINIKETKDGKGLYLNPYT